MGNKHTELKTCVQLQGYGCFGITKVLWDDSHDWCAAIQ